MPLTLTYPEFSLTKLKGGNDYRIRIGTKRYIMTFCTYSSRIQ